MSLGFLTESSLLPGKQKKIKVDGRSMFDLKAIVYEEEQKVLEKGKTKHKVRKLVQNRNVRDRDEKDREVVQDDSLKGKLQQSKRQLKRKAKLYEMYNGQVPEDAVLASGEGGLMDKVIEVQDEFGRTNYISKVEFERNKEKYVDEEEKVEGRKLDGVSSNFVTSQWEKRWKEEEKEYMVNLSKEKKVKDTQVDKKRKRLAALKARKMEKNVDAFLNEMNQI